MVSVNLDYRLKRNQSADLYMYIILKLYLVPPLFLALLKNNFHQYIEHLKPFKMSTSLSENSFENILLPQNSLTFGSI